MARICLYCERFPHEEFSVAPLGVGYLAAYLLKYGGMLREEVRIVDSIEEAIACNPDILGVGSVSQVLHHARDFARKCKEKTGCITVLGGYHITCAPDTLPDEFDIGVLGEGEVTFLELCRALLDKEISFDVLKSIAGICFRQKGRVEQTSCRPMISDIDRLPSPLRHKNYSRSIPVFTSRGCPYKCTYCASPYFWKDKCRFRSASSVVEEICQLVENYSPSEIAFLDDLWISQKQRFREIVDGLEKSGITQKVTFSGFCRSNLVFDEEIRLLKRLNYRFVRFGAETGSEKLLKRIKGDAISIDDHQRLIDLCHTYGLSCGASFMFGLPGETLEDIKQTVNFLRKNKGKCIISGFYLCNPIPGTKLWFEMISRGDIGNDLDLAHLQLDMMRSDFKWENLLYFNDKNIPKILFQEVIEDIKQEFIFKTKSMNDNSVLFLN